MSRHFTIHQYVWDLASGMRSRVVQVRGAGAFYLLDHNIPLDPTGDGAFPSRWRLCSELSFTKPTQDQLDDFVY